MNAKAIITMEQADSPQVVPLFRVGQRVHSVGNSRRIGTVRYVGPVDSYSGIWIGVDWDDGEAKHDGSINGVSYFSSKSEMSGSFVRPMNLSSGISLLDALMLRYRAESEIEDEMYVFSASNRRVSVSLVGMDQIQEKLSHFEELVCISLPYLGVCTLASSSIAKIIPNLKELDLTGNLFSEWKDVGVICRELSALQAINLSNNTMSHDIVELQPLNHIRILVLNNTGINWMQVEILKSSLPVIEELHLMHNKISTIMQPASTATVQGFTLLRLLNLGDNCISKWDEILKLSQLPSLEQLHLRNNNLNCICYPSIGTSNENFNGHIFQNNTNKPFQNLYCLLLGGNNIVDVASIDSLNYFPKLTDVRLSENPISDPEKGGVPRFVLIARLAKVELLNGSQVSSRERKDSEIRYVRLLTTTLNDNPDEIKLLHPRFGELKHIHGIEEERPKSAGSGPQNMLSGLVSVNLRCVVASIGEQPPLTKKLPATTTVGKLKRLCESFFKLGHIRAKLFLQEEGCPIPILVDDEFASLTQLGINNDSTIIVDVDG